MEVTVGTAWQNSQTLLFLHEKRQKITWKVEVVSLLLKKKNVLKKCTKGYKKKCTKVYKKCTKAIAEGMGGGS